MEGDAAACIRGKLPSYATTEQTVSFNNEQPLVYSPNVVGYLARLEASKTYTAIFKSGQETVQEITFSFKEHPNNHVCFRYDYEQKAWSVGPTPGDFCSSCIGTLDGT